MPLLIQAASLEAVDPAVRRKQVTDHIHEIARLTKQAMADRGLNFSVGLLVPGSGEALLSFVTTTDPTDDEWDRVCDIVTEVAERVLGIKGLISRELPSVLVNGESA